MSSFVSALDSPDSISHKAPTSRLNYQIWKDQHYYRFGSGCPDKIFYTKHWSSVDTFSVKLESVPSEAVPKDTWNQHVSKYLEVILTSFLQ